MSYAAVESVIFVKLSFIIFYYLDLQRKERIHSTGAGTWASQGELQTLGGERRTQASLIA